MEIPSPDDIQKKNDAGVGPLIGIVVIVALFVVGGIYFLVTQKLQKQSAPPATQEQA